MLQIWCQILPSPKKDFTNLRAFCLRVYYYSKNENKPWFTNYSHATVGFVINGSVYPQLKQPCWPAPSSQPRWPSQPRCPPPPGQTPFSHFWRQANFAICPNLRPTMSAHARTASRKKNVKCEMPFLARHFLLSRAMFFHNLWPWLSGVLCQDS